MRSSIAATAIAVWLFCICDAIGLAIIGALALAILLSFGQLPVLALTARLAFAVGARYGLIVGVTVGAVFALLVVAADRHGRQRLVADAMPPIAALLTLAVTAVVFRLGWLLLLAPLAIAFSWLGAAKVAQQYLRAEAPRIRQLVH
jgi:hypothetical protein